MSTYLDLTVRFSDGTEPVTLELVQGVQRDVFFKYAEENLATMPFDKPITVNSLTDFQKISKIAAAITQVKVYTTDMSRKRDGSRPEYHIGIVNQASSYTAMIYAAERRALFEQSKDRNIKKAIYTRYAEMYNNGNALFGAQLKNIDTITFQFS